MGNLTEGLIWFNGEIIPYENAKINIMNATAQYGINVFEGIRCYYNKEYDQLYAFRLDDHLNRLFQSAKLLKFILNEGMTKEFLINNIINVIKANDYNEDLYIKICMFLDSEGSWSSLSPIGMVIYPYPKGRVYSDKIGINCCISSWGRISEFDIPPRIKAGANYINSRYALLEATMNGYDSSIFLNKDGKVAEGPGACIFCLRNNKLITPPITASILESITRDTIINLAKNELGLIVEEREIDRTELYISDEVFFAGTSIEILPILSVDHYIINNSEVGYLTKALSELYFDIVIGKKHKYNNWLTKLER
jgi:branched-chain amino acid aminotransferase